MCSDIIQSILCSMGGRIPPSMPSGCTGRDEKARNALSKENHILATPHLVAAKDRAWIGLQTGKRRFEPSRV